MTYDLWHWIWIYGVTTPTSKKATGYNRWSNQVEDWIGKKKRTARVSK